MALLESFFDVGASVAPMPPVSMPRARRGCDPDAAPIQVHEPAASAEDISAHRQQLVNGRLAWLADEQRDALTSCFVPLV